MKKDIVSIITTCYNCETFVTQAVASILSQNVNDEFTIEYIIVNDKSTDNTANVINNTIAHFKDSIKGKIKVNVYNLKTNLGCGGARKYGISKSHGQYLMFLDADDYYIYSDFVLRARNDIKKYDADIVDYGIKFNQVNGEVNYINVPNIIEITNNPTQQVLSIFENNIIKFNVWSKIYTREIVNTQAYSDTRTYEDIRTIPIWVYNAKKIIIMPSIEINYRANNDSIIRKDTYDTRLGTVTAMYDIFEYFRTQTKNGDINILKSIYKRAMIDLEFVLDGHSSDDKYFNELSYFNTKMLSHIYPNDYKNLTYNIESNQSN